jgi:cysteine desulfurase
MQVGVVVNMVDGNDRVEAWTASMPADTMSGPAASMAMDLEVLPDARIDLAAGTYLDANATAEPLPEVVAAILDVFSAGAANAASPHSRGTMARTRIQAACDETAGIAAGLLPENIVFTSNGTEANNASLAGVPWSSETTLIVGATEHASILKAAEIATRLHGVDVRVVPVDRRGIVRSEEFRHAVSTARSNLLVSLQWANGETGVVQPIERLASQTRSQRADAFFHSDAAQAAGRVPLSIGPVVPIDALSISGHKFHGPQGIGAVLLADPDRFAPGRLMFGGGQQRGMRAGTEPTHLVAGMGAAARIRIERFEADVGLLRKLRDAFERRILERCDDAVVNGVDAERLPNTANIRFPGVDGAALIANLDHRGVFCSQASACSSGRPEPSHVLTAMGLEERDAHASVRFSMSVLNMSEEVVRAADIVADTVELLRAKGASW